jgi:hypothetical protein
MKPLDVLHVLYTKNFEAITVEEWYPLYFSKVLSQDKDNADALNKILEYCFYISAQHYYYLLYFFIPKKFIYSKKLLKKTEEIEEDKLISKIKYILGWSEREFRLNKKAIEHEILTNREYWEGELGIGKDTGRLEKIKRNKKECNS